MSRNSAIEIDALERQIAQILLYMNVRNVKLKYTSTATIATSNQNTLAQASSTKVFTMTIHQLAMTQNPQSGKWAVSLV